MGVGSAQLMRVTVDALDELERVDTDEAHALAFGLMLALADRMDLGDQVAAALGFEIVQRGDDAWGLRWLGELVPDDIAGV